MPQLDKAAFRRCFDACGLSQKELATKSGVSPETIRNLYSRATCTFRMDTIVKVARALSIESEQLIVRETENPGISLEFTIAEPKSGSALSSRQIAVRGTIGNLEQGVTLWLVVAKGHLHWPKATKIAIANGTFSAHIFEGGAFDSPFDLLLWAVPAVGTRQIQQWLAEGDANDSYPGLPMVAGIIPLARVCDLSLRQTAKQA